MRSLFLLLFLGHIAKVIQSTNFSAAWTTFISDAQVSHAISSVTVLDNTTGTIMFTSNKDIGLAPASTLKTVTGAAALHYLRPDYRYETLLQYSGILDDYGNLDGYIYIVGGGDPTLGSERWNETNGETIMNHWTSLIRETGIKQCRGIVADLSVWPEDTQTVPDGYIWGDIGNYYGTGSSVLNWRENQFRLILSPGQSIGDPVALVAIDHQPPALTIINQATTGPPGSGDRTNMYLSLDGGHAYLRGSLAIDLGKNFSVGGAVPNSGLYIADELRQKMSWPSHRTELISLTREISDMLQADRTTLDIHHSPPVSEILYWLEHDSINLYGELILKTIAHVMNCTPNDILPMYCKNEHGIEQTAVATIDGSGLSPENRITTGTIARVLFDVQRESWFSVYQSALPMIHDIRMKSGYIRNVLSYAGYVNNSVFSIMVNNFNGETNSVREKIWNLLDTLK